MSIRKVESKDFKRLIELWLEASVRAHHFIDTGYWTDKVQEMKDIYLPKSETWVLEDEKEILKLSVQLWKII